MSFPELLNTYAEAARNRTLEISNHVVDTLLNKPIPPIPLPHAIAYSTFIFLAGISIYFGSHLSVSRVGAEKLTSKDAYMFPVIGSGVLFGLYVLFKLLSKDILNLLLTAYFLFFGVASLTATLSSIIDVFTPKSLQKKYKKTLSLPFLSEPLSLEFSINDFLGLLLAVAHSAWYLISGKHWIANNVFGVAFCVQGISLISLGEYHVGLILLSGLFIYDIFWVFFTDVMVTVAKSFDAPIKLLFPRDIFAEKFEFAMLGLGDIVIPGIFIALLLRFDVHRRRNKPGSNTYFLVTLLNYVLGLATTMFVMHTFKSAQPALLYLVPYCIISSFFTALVRGEIGKLFSYSDEHRQTGDKKEKKGGKKGSKEEKSDKKAKTSGPQKQEKSKQSGENKAKSSGEGKKEGKKSKDK